MNGAFFADFAPVKAVKAEEAQNKYYNRISLEALE